MMGLLSAMVGVGNTVCQVRVLALVEDKRGRCSFMSVWSFLQEMPIGAGAG